MTRVVDLTSLSVAFDTQIIWRRREVSDLKHAIRSAADVSKPSLLRAFIPILYAHWEGFWIAAAEDFFRMITARRLQVGLLTPHYGNLIFLKRLDALSASKFSQKEKLDLLNEIRNCDSLRLSRMPRDLIDSGSNLNTARARSICDVCGITSSFLDGAEDLIDKQILDRRNKIAHGEWAAIAESEVDDLVDRLFSLLASFRNELENVAASESYRRSTT
jgi:hypothetical protein